MTFSVVLNGSTIKNKNNFRDIFPNLLLRQAYIPAVSVFNLEESQVSYQILVSINMGCEQL